MGRIIAACVVAMFGIVTLGVRAPATHADSVGGLGVYVAYADSLRANQPAFPTPWDGSPNTVFKGQEDAGSAYDAGAVRLDNFTSDAITVDSVHVFIHPN